MNRSAREATEYNLIVLSAGAGGENVADRAVQGGNSWPDEGKAQWVVVAGIRHCWRVDFRAGAAL